MTPPNHLATVRYHGIAILVLLAALSGCTHRDAGSGTDSTAPLGEPGRVAGGQSNNGAEHIEWYKGTVDEAFAAAKSSNKPIFLYWGAVWCPPCHAVKTTIFTRPEFIERSRLFVPVYLDGDDPNAQAIGEKFGVVGYPTMIVFNSNGEELTRIPGGIDLQAYANVLDLTITNAAPTKQIVASLLDGQSNLSQQQCTLLAYYSWDQDTRILENRDQANAFRKMYEACPVDAGKERSILYLAWLDAYTKKLADAGSNQDASQRDEALAQLEKILSSDELRRTNALTLVFSGADFTAALTDKGSETRARLAQDFLTGYDKLANDGAVYLRDRIYTLEGELNFERLDTPDAEASLPLQTKIRAMTASAIESTQERLARQPIINALGNVLTDAGMYDDARTLLQAELKNSDQPYYYMASLADIEQRAGHNDKALAWLKQAHDLTKGPATRFQWGYYYVTGLLEMAPGDVDTIRQTTVDLVTELQSRGGFYQRPKAELLRLQKKLLDWSAKNGGGDTLRLIHNSLASHCANDKQSESKARCVAFLDSV